MKRKLNDADNQWDFSVLGCFIDNKYVRVCNQSLRSSHVSWVASLYFLISQCGLLYSKSVLYISSKNNHAQGSIS